MPNSAISVRCIFCNGQVLKHLHPICATNARETLTIGEIAIGIS